VETVSILGFMELSYVNLLTVQGVAKVLSPLIPAVLVIGQSVAAERLREKGILCVDLQRITLGGKVKIFAFDKTGLLFSILTT
jgi:magnesium-transporting ATPase (P-type)